MMKKSKEFDNILDECLERVIKGESVEECLSGYPDYASELEPLLRMASDARGAVDIKPSPEFRERASYQFQAALREMEPVKGHGFFRWQPRLVGVVAIVLALLIVGSGTVAAAGNSLPDGLLYPVKMATETVQLAFTPSAEGKAELYVKFADKRVDEIIKMAEKGKAKQVEKATERLNEQLIAMANLDLVDGEELLDAQISTFEGVPAPEPSPTPAPRPAPAAEPEAEEAPPLMMQTAPAPAEELEEETIVTAPKGQGPPEDAGQGRFGRGGGGAKPDKHSQLREQVSNHALENSQALQALLEEEMDEEVRLALLEAIDVINAGYEQALRNLD